MLFQQRAENRFHDSASVERERGNCIQSSDRETDDLKLAHRFRFDHKNSPDQIQNGRERGRSERTGCGNNPLLSRIDRILSESHDRTDGINRNLHGLESKVFCGDQMRTLMHRQRCQTNQQHAAFADCDTPKIKRKNRVGYADFRSSE
ncbi:MAG: hypothetical protein IJJ86_03545 [Clostridia bacterium]|nr:hypothetical protein [Clostridia bacterium]